MHGIRPSMLLSLIVVGLRACQADVDVVVGQLIEDGQGERRATPRPHAPSGILGNHKPSMHHT